MLGLRIALSVHVPGPWGMAAKQLFELRAVPYIPVAQFPSEDNRELADWTGCRNAPVAVYNDEPAVSSWLDILFLSERLGEGESLLPSDPLQRALCLGLCHEVCGQWGLGWARRLMILHQFWGDTDASQVDAAQQSMRLAYGYNPAAISAAPSRVIEILTVLDQQLRQQKAAGQSFLVGDRLTALDVYWANFAATVAPMEAERCPMPDYLRDLYGNLGVLEGKIPEALIEHRDYVYREYLTLPVQF